MAESLAEDFSALSGRATVEVKLAPSGSTLTPSLLYAHIARANGMRMAKGALPRNFPVR
jgi:hypothetical protein